MVAKSYFCSSPLDQIFAGQKLWSYTLCHDCGICCNVKTAVEWGPIILHAFWFTFWIKVCFPSLAFSGFLEYRHFPSIRSNYMRSSDFPMVQTEVFLLDDVSYQTQDFLHYKPKMVLLRVLSFFKCIFTFFGVEVFGFEFEIGLQDIYICPVRA